MAQVEFARAHFCIHCRLIVYIFLINLAIVNVHSVANWVDEVTEDFIVQLTPEVSENYILEIIPGSRILKKYTIGPLQYVLMRIHDAGSDSTAAQQRVHDLIQSIVARHPNISLFPDHRSELVGYAGSGYTSNTATSSSDTSSSDTSSNDTSSSDTSSSDTTNSNEIPTYQCHEQQNAINKYWGLARLSRVDHQSTDSTINNHSSSYHYDTTGQCVIVYVLDSGINEDHEEFEGRATNGYIAEGMNESNTDLFGHGTHIAGIVAGAKSGVAKHATVISVKVMNKEGKGQLSWLLDGLSWVYAHLQTIDDPRVLAVINLSLGIYDPDRILDHSFQLVFDELKAVTVVAAGNQKIDACDYVPSRLPNVITVGATNKDDQLMDMGLAGSNLGPCVDILAPGHAIVSASHVGGTQQEATMSGTSQAAAFVSGVVARHLQRMREQPTSQEILTLLQQTGSTGKINVGATEHPENVTLTTDLFLHVSCNELILIENITNWTSDSNSTIKQCNIPQARVGATEQTERSSTATSTQSSSISEASIPSHTITPTPSHSLFPPISSSASSFSSSFPFSLGPTITTLGSTKKEVNTLDSLFSHDDSSHSNFMFVKDTTPLVIGLTCFVVLCIVSAGCVLLYLFAKNKKKKGNAWTSNHHTRN